MANRQLVLEKTSGGIAFYKMVIPELRVKGSQCELTRNPFYDDSNPSLSIYLKNDEWRFNDFGDPEYKGNVIDFASYHYGLDIKKDYKQILNNIIEDMESLTLSDKQKFANVEKSATLASQKHIEFTLNERDANYFTDEELKFWSQYGIDKTALQNAKVVAVDGYTERSPDDFSKTYSRKEEMWFAFKGPKHAKLYCPYPKKFWYVGSKSQDFTWGSGIDFFDQEVEFILTAGEKDALTLIAHGFNAITLNSETALPSRRLIKSLYESRIKVSVLYDIDETGLKQSLKLEEEFGFKRIVLPKWLIEKGGKDVSDFFRLGGTKDELLSLINFSEVNTQPEVERKSVRTASQRLADASALSEIKKLVDVFLHTGELAILFGDTGVGKSILGIAIADAISKGVKFLELENECEPQKVLYYDFELSDKQFEKRYSDNEGKAHSFNRNLYTDSIDFAELKFDRQNKFETVLIDKIKEDIKSTGASVIFIDNITFISSQSSQDAQVAMELMKMLKQMKQELDITIVVMAHTPKRRSSEHFSINDLAGSKHLSNFADSVFAIGMSQSDRGYRYMRQVKPSRSGEYKYDQTNVVKCELTKIDSFLTFRFISYCNEATLLTCADPDYEEEMKKKAIELRNKGKTFREMERELNISKSKIGRWLKN
ncbi:AAA family ATPase [Solitalea koreensis]|uniref:AAA domain-containing protein n=1 Tax=Solitalea koreensis TaxID=543615 RepID=A0A521DKW7_9SPHI|nr:AAA family ATPase [Solitalea koreensis]SMO72349.1 AAA domain-containing protein [Solitalea koreensis]